MHRYYH
eukprot:gene20239-26276_t